MLSFSFWLRLYLPLGLAVLAGIAISGGLSSWSPGSSQRRAQQLGSFLFWIGVPISIVSFVREADFSGAVLLAPLVAWGTMLLGLGCSQLWLRRRPWSRPSQGSFTLASMLGNTGYLGYPIVLLLPQLGPDYFGWALFYDALGTLFGAYGLGVVLAAEFGAKQGSRPWYHRLREAAYNPTILAFGLGLGLRPVPLPAGLERGLQVVAWTVVMLSLVLMGMRLQQLSSWHQLRPAAAVVAIKMLLLPLVVGIVLTLAGVSGGARLVLVLQAGMPCAFANLLLAEVYELDQALTVTCIGLSSMALLVTLPVWLWGFASS